jgi:hypothetical protein
MTTFAEKKPDLEVALGLKRGRGERKRAATENKNYERAKRVFLMREAGATWSEIAEAFPTAGLRELQRELNRYTPDLIAARIGIIGKLFEDKSPTLGD